MGGDLIKEARRRAGLTQVELAERANTTQSAIARWERGRVDPGFDTVRRLLRLCGFHLEVALVPWEDGMADDMHQAQQTGRLDDQGRYRHLVHFADTIQSSQKAAGVRRFRSANW